MENGKKKFVETPPAPAPTEFSDGVSDLESTKEEELPLSQPPPEDNVALPLIPVEDPSSTEE
jgi:hypothetical protein